MKRETLYYDLPKHAIAQRPVSPRDHSRLLVVHVPSGRLYHDRFYNLVQYLPSGAVLVLNRTRVIKARLEGEKETGGKVVVVVFPPQHAPLPVGIGGGDSQTVPALLQRGKVRPGQKIQIQSEVIEVVEQQGKWVTLRFASNMDVNTFLENYGKMPLPPYIQRDIHDADEAWYQPITAQESGSIAAPTASLHFTPHLFHTLQNRGINIVEILLHVGPGTFLPILTERIENHRMLPEYYEIPKETQKEIQQARQEGRPVIAVGTTCTRALETWALGEGPTEGFTDLFIYPGYPFRVLDGLVTNFHQPPSTPLALVAAFAGLDLVHRVYQEALRKGYRFLSYGDASLWMRFPFDKE